MSGPGLTKSWTSGTVSRRSSRRRTLWPAALWATGFTVESSVTRPNGCPHALRTQWRLAHRAPAVGRPQVFGTFRAPLPFPFDPSPRAMVAQRYWVR
eukprot:13416982-Alexandrium_andersonii.AAC.1